MASEIPETMLSQLYRSGIVARRKSSRIGFSSNQMAEFKVQVLIFDFFRRATPVPLQLLNHIRTTGNPRNADPEPGRCRRTDGKKWRCANDAVVDQKYCLKHMHRGKHKAKKRLTLPENQPNGRRLKTIANNLSVPLLTPNALASNPRFNLLSSHNELICSNRLNHTLSTEQLFRLETPAFNNNWIISSNNSTPRHSLQLDDASTGEFPWCMLPSSHLLPTEEGSLLSSDAIPSPSSRSTEEFSNIGMVGSWAWNWNIPTAAWESRAVDGGPLAEVVLQSSFSNAVAAREQWENVGPHFCVDNLSLSSVNEQISSSCTTNASLYDSSSGSSSTFRIDPLISISDASE